MDGIHRRGLELLGRAQERVAESFEKHPVVMCVSVALSTGLFAVYVSDKLEALSKARKSAKVKNALAQSNKRLSVGIIGGGFGSLETVKLCREMGLDYHIYEKNSELGGTWLQNTYPGCACDVPAHMYNFSWASNPDWSASYVTQPEILDYIMHVAYDILKIEKGKETSFNTKVVRATFSCETAKWELEVQDVQTGEASMHEHDFLISAVGQLSAPSVPEQLRATVGKFKGLSFHSATWPANADLKGKKVVVIGSGCSAAQFAPVIAPQCSELVICQRSPGYILAKSVYDYSSITRFFFRNFPFLLRLYRAFLFGFQEFLYHTIIHSDGRNPNASNRLVQVVFSAGMRRMAPKELHNKLLPSYTVGCKRIIVSSDWLPMFKRPNVRLVSSEVTEITTDGVRCKDGEEVRGVDVIIFGTGFTSSKFLSGLTIAVKETGVDLHKTVWSKIPFAYGGLSVPGIPNFGILYGPNTNTGHTSVVSFLEIGAEHFFSLVGKLVFDKKRMFEVDERACKEYNEKEQAKLRETVWNDDRTHNWYRLDDGMIINNWHGSYLEFRATNTRPNFRHYNFH